MVPVRVNWFTREPGGSTTYIAPPQLEWRTSSRCSAGGCVEIGLLSDGGAVVRSTHNPSLSLTFPGEEWTDFLTDAKAGNFG